MSQGRSTPCIEDGRPPTFKREILIMGPYKPLRTWVDEFIPYYMEISWEFRLDPIAHMDFESLKVRADQWGNNPQGIPPP